MSAQAGGETDYRRTLADGVNAGELKSMRPEQVFELGSVTPSSVEDGVESWILRGENWVMEYSQRAPGSSTPFEYTGASHEHLIVLFDEASCSLTWEGTESRHDGGTIIIVPPGTVSGTIEGSGRVLRMFTLEAEDLVARSINGNFYIENPPEPAQESGLRSLAGEVRAFPLDAPAEEGRFGRIWTTTHLMVNLLEERYGPRDPKALSPHAHADFEQTSLVIDGEYVHHLRWPWGTDSTRWRNDVHVHVGSPSATMIPRGVTHTSEAVGSDLNLIMDIVAPPRDDWRQRGWVLNGADYPATAE